MLNRDCINKPFIAIFLFVAMIIFPSCGPQIVSFTPDHGVPGTIVTITGFRFGATQAENTVKFGNTTAQPSDFISVSTTTVKVKVPAGAVTGLITITTSKGTGRSDKNFLIDTNANWTFMVYLDADNNLEGAGLDDFQEMASVGSKNGVNIVVMMDRITGYSSTNPDWSNTRRFLISGNSTPTSTPLMDMGELNMGDPSVLQDFVEWSVTNYPAKHYALSIWNHGDGWRKNREMMDSLRMVRAQSRSGDQETLLKAVASDDTDGDILYMREVQDALGNARQSLESKGTTNVKIDVIGFDACLMGMVEVAYAIRSHTNYMVASEETEPGDGWPYNTILADLTSNPGMTPEALAKNIVVKYGISYPNTAVTQAAYDISKLEAVAQKIDDFTTRANTNWAGLKTARNGSRQYHPTGYPSFWGTDIWDFADRSNNNCSSTDIRNAAQELKTAINSFVIQEFHSAALNGSHGVAIYFPPNQTSFNNDPQHTGYVQANTFMPVDFVLLHQWDNWLPTFYSNIP